MDPFYSTHEKTVQFRRLILAAFLLSVTGYLYNGPVFDVAYKAPLDIG